MGSGRGPWIESTNPIVNLWSRPIPVDLSVLFCHSRRIGRLFVILRLGQDEIIVECGQETLLSLRELQLPNRARISARDFVNGVNPRVGDLFT